MHTANRLRGALIEKAMAENRADIAMTLARESLQVGNG